MVLLLRPRYVCGGDRDAGFVRATRGQTLRTAKEVEEGECPRHVVCARREKMVRPPQISPAAGGAGQQRALR